MNIRHRRITQPADLIEAAKSPAIFRPDGLPSLEKSLAVDFPEYDVVPFGFMAIEVPAGLNLNGLPAWYGLSRTTIKKDTADELLLSAYFLSMKPADTAGAGDTRVTAAAGGFLSWGVASAAPNAYIVIGKGLPITPGVWQPGPVIAPGLNTAAATAGEALLFTQNRPREMIVRSLPGGSYASSTKETIIENKAPSMKGFRDGDNLDVALVVAPGALDALAQAKTLVGYVYGEFTLTKRFASVQLTETR